MLNLEKNLKAITDVFNALKDLDPNDRELILNGAQKKLAEADSKEKKRESSSDCGPYAGFGPGNGIAMASFVMGPFR